MGGGSSDDAAECSSPTTGVYCLRRRKKRAVPLSPRSEASESPVAYRFSVEDEAKAWDAFYGAGHKSDDPFSGFNAADTVRMIRGCLRRIRSPPLVDCHDVVLEVGHGKHPLIWDFAKSFSDFGLYSGIEFSGDSIREAIKLRQRTTGSSSPPELGANVEFLRATSVSYFRADGTCDAEVVLPEGGGAPRLRAGAATLVLAKSTLDYITCRLTGSVDTLDWHDQPRIAPSVVEMFDAFSVALGEPSAARTRAVIFVEPGDFVKFRDHIATIARVLYAATFRGDSPSKWLRLTHVRRHKELKAVCYTLQKTGAVYGSYEELRSDICRVTARLYQLSEVQDDDWLLPITVPPKWNGTSDGDLEQLSAL